MKIYVSHSNSFDYENELYIPLRKLSKEINWQFVLPHDQGKNLRTHDEIIGGDAIIAEVSFPSTGSGIEIGIAYEAKLPIICIFKKGKKISSALSFVTDNFIEYEDGEDLGGKVLSFL